MNDGHTHDKIHNRNASESETTRSHLTGRHFSCRRLKLRVGDVLAVLATKVKAAVCAVLLSSAEPVLFSLPVQGKRPVEE